MFSRKGTLLLIVSFAVALPGWLLRLPCIDRAAAAVDVVRRIPLFRHAMPHVARNLPSLSLL